MKKLTIIVLTIIVICLVIFDQREHFATKREKASTIVDWFNSTPEHSYNSYRKSVKPSNIVEYEDSLNLFKTRNFTVEDVERML